MEQEMDGLNSNQFDAWYVKKTPCGRSNRLFDKIDMDLYDQCMQQYERLTKEERQKYKGKKGYVKSVGGMDLSPSNENYIKMNLEAAQQLKSHPAIDVLSIDYVVQENMVSDLLASFEDEMHIKNVYKQKKLQVQSGLNTGTATVIMNCMRQGRSLLNAGQQADILAKPLIDFYAASAYVYAMIVVNSPLHKSLDSLKGSHGHVYDHKNKAVAFGGKMPTGTFLDLLCALFIGRVVVRNDVIQYSLLDSVSEIQDCDIQISLCALLSMVPEIQTYYARVDEIHKCVHKITVDTNKSRDGETTEYNFYIGDGVVEPDDEKLKQVFKTENIQKIHNSYTVVVDAKKVTDIAPTIYQDIRGDLWYIEPIIENVVLPEICLHFLIISALSNIMRYAPHEWSDILNNKISPSFSLLVSRYLRLFEKKFPMLLVQYLSSYYPVLQMR